MNGTQMHMLCVCGEKVTLPLNEDSKSFAGTCPSCGKKWFLVCVGTEKGEGKHGRGT